VLRHDRPEDVEAEQSSCQACRPDMYMRLHATVRRTAVEQLYPLNTERLR